MNGPDSATPYAPGRPLAVVELPAHVLAAQLGIAAAWERVLAKAGMPGVDGVPVSRFGRMVPGALSSLEQQLASGDYRPLPLRIAEMEKKRGGRRLLLVPAVRDRIALTAVASWLGTKWNGQFDSASFAYRPGMGVHAALRYLRELHHSGFRWVFDADIRSCFDSIDHDRLFTRLASCLGANSAILSWLRAWVGAPVWDGADVSRLSRGIAQGSPLSPLLANLFLDQFDRRLREAGVKFIRYADDFLVLTRTPFDITAARDLVDRGLRELGLELNDEKTRTTTFDQWFRFLGAEIQGDAILLPFEKKRAGSRPVFVAPVMPPSLLRAWRHGQIACDRPFVWARRSVEAVHAFPQPRAVGQAATLKRLAGGEDRAMRQLRGR